MTDNQPKWKLVANVGDSNPFEDGGQFVFKDVTGKYSPELLIIEPLHIPGYENIAQTSRIVLNPCTYIDGVLSDNKFHPDHPAWFADKLDSIASTCGYPREYLINLLTSQDLAYRAIGYHLIYLSYGAENLGSEYETEKISDLRRKYGRLKALN